MTLKDLLIFFKPGSGCDYHRLALPYGYMGYDFKQGVDLTPEKVRQFRGVVFNRIPLTIETETLVNLREMYGHKIIMDVDDHWVLPKTHYLLPSWEKNKTTERIVGLLKIADVVTCTTERLAEKVREFNRNVVVIPNSLPFIGHGQFAYNRTPGSNVRFGFAGGSSHLYDVKQIAPVFQHFNHLHFKYCGYNPNHPHVVKMAEIFSNGGKNPNYRHVNMQPLDTYLYGYNDIDVCIAPLEDTEFNKYKSNLKVLEAGLKKCAIICSPVDCYTDTVPDTVVTYAKSIKDWKAAIKAYSNKDYAKEKGEQLYEWVKANYNLSEINKKRLELLES